MSDVRHVVAAELHKLWAQLSVRLLVLLAVLVPLLFAVLVKAANASPGDTLFGAWVQSSGFALGLVLLAVMASFGFPIIAALLAGDIFSAEDRHDTWKNVLTRAVSRRAVFWGKFIAASLSAVALLVLTGAVAIAAGVLIIGPQALVNLSGHLQGSGTQFGLALAAWALDIPPLIAFVALGVLCSVATRSGIAGVLGPIVLALLMQLLQRVGNGGVGHQLLLLAAFDAWHGVYTDPVQGLPILAAVVSLGWAAAALGAAWWLFSRREFAGRGGGPGRSRWRDAGLLLGGALAFGAVLVALCFVGSDPVTPARLEASIKPTFNRLTILQQQLLGRTVVAGAKLNDTAVCARRGLARSGAGDDWVCTVNVLIPQIDTPTPNFEPVDYDVTVKVNGCWSADGPPSFIGNQTFSVDHKRHYNPLFEIYGCLNPV